MNNQLYLKMIALTVAVTVASVASPALADERWHGRGHDKHDRDWHDEGWHRDGFIGGFVVGPPVVYLRPPVVYVAPPPPIYYVPPAPPVIEVRPGPSVSLGVTIPLH